MTDNANDRITLYETLPSKNWPSGRRPEWLDERTRLYTGVTINAAAQQWTEIVTHYDGEATTAYLTRNGFDVRSRGPALEAIGGDKACHRKVIRKWFADTYQKEVDFR